jgi:IS5 family transposase
MKIFTDFSLKEGYKRLQSNGDKVAEIDSLIDRESFRIIFESIYFNKTVHGCRPEAELTIMLKIFFYRNFIIYPTLNLRNYVLIEFLSENFLGFLSTYQKVPKSVQT